MARSVGIGGSHRRPPSAHGGRRTVAAAPVVAGRGRTCSGSTSGTNRRAGTSVRRSRRPPRPRWPSTSGAGVVDRLLDASLQGHRRRRAAVTASLHPQPDDAVGRRPAARRRRRASGARAGPGRGPGAPASRGRADAVRGARAGCRHELVAASDSIRRVSGFARRGDLLEQLARGRAVEVEQGLDDLLRSAPPASRGRQRLDARSGTSSPARCGSWKSDVEVLPNSSAGLLRC